ncbi:MAG: universal stress protein [Allosphingosinicella sp.]
MISQQSGDTESVSSAPAFFVTRAPSASPTEKAGKRRRWRVLACINGAPIDLPVVRHALAVAGSLDLPVTVGRVLETPRRPDSPADPMEWQMRRSECRFNLEQVASAGGGGSELESVLLAGSAADELANWSKDNDVTLIVIATHERASHVNDGLGSTAQGILVRAQTSMLLVPVDRPSGETCSYRRILVPLDGSPRAESVLPVAARLARAHGAELILAHVVPTLETVDDMALEPQASDLCARLADHSERGARAYLEELRGRLSREMLPVRAIVATHGDPRALLRRMIVDEHVDLAVMSSHGKSGLGDMPCGSVTEYLATHASVPLLIVRPNFAHVFGGADDHPAEIVERPILKSAP